MSHGHGHDDHHDEHGHEEHDSHGHDDHYDEHDSPGHDNHSGHHDNHGDHSGDDHHDEHDAHGHDDHEHDEHDEDDEEKEFEKLNDLTQVTYGELETVDMGEIHILSPLKPFKSLFKADINDILLKEKNKINLSLGPRIKILGLKRPIFDIKKVKKNTDINVNTNTPISDKNTLNMIQLKEVFYQKGPYSDIIPPQKNILKKVIQFTQNISFSLPSFTQEDKEHTLFGRFNFPKISFPHFPFKISFDVKKLNYYKTGIYFIFTLALLVSYGIIAQMQVKTTLNEVKNFQFSSDIESMKKNFVSLKSDIILSRILLKPVFFINHIFQNQNISNLEYAFSGVAYLTNYGINVVTIFEGTQNLALQKGPNEILYSELYKNIFPILSTAEQNINLSLDAFAQIQNIGNPELEKTFEEKIKLIKMISNVTNELVIDKNQILTLLGDENKRTYLVVFQNNDEIRPTGGFMGSVGFLQLFKGQIKNFEKKDIYALEWNIKDTFQEKAPYGLEEITDKFTLRDANYFPDIKESSEKIKSFIDKTQYHIDGIVYVNQNVILDFLRKFGGISFPEVKRDITADNFSMIVSTLVETKVTKTHTLATPKQVLFDFMDLYLENLKKQAKYTQYAETFLQSIEKKDIMIYDFDPKMNDLFSKVGFKNTIAFQNYVDFNYPTFTSISGNKSDRYIERNFEKNVSYNADCSINSDFKITLNHTFNINEEIAIKNFLYDVDLLGRVDLGGTLFTQGKGANKQFVRVLVPKNSQIKENKNIKIQDFADYKEISFFMTTDIGLPSKMKFSYTLANPECKPYNYFFEKQPGLKEYKLTLQKDENLVLDSYLSRDYVFGN